MGAPTIPPVAAVAGRWRPIWSRPSGGVSECVPKFTPRRGGHGHRVAMTFAPIIAALSGVYVAVLYALRRRRGDAISHHPYRDPYGDTPAAWRSTTSARDARDSLQRAPGTR